MYGQPRKNRKPLTELEKLEKENQLKIEISLLKSESLSQGQECPSTHDWAKAIEGLRQKGHPLQFMLQRMKMARLVFYYHLSHRNDSDGYDSLRAD
ncbi:MAG TPA: hypothetical protein PLF38_01055 [Xylanibacter oryzae]|nr:hypothetical protein [Xylanibacter oryzae]